MMLLDPMVATSDSSSFDAKITRASDGVLLMTIPFGTSSFAFSPDSQTFAVLVYPNALGGATIQIWQVPDKHLFSPSICTELASSTFTVELAYIFQSSITSRPRSPAAAKFPRPAAGSKALPSLASRDASRDRPDCRAQVANWTPCLYRVSPSGCIA